MGCGEVARLPMGASAGRAMVTDWGGGYGDRIGWWELRGVCHVAFALSDLAGTGARAVAHIGLCEIGLV